MRETYLEAYSGKLTVSYSIWNIGEVLGVMDRAKRLGMINGEAYSTARSRFLSETRRMIRLGIALRNS
nr:hypothetical protein [Candidatus Freyrarchaeum guaymaensis]